jgi:hypothetical protein
MNVQDTPMNAGGLGTATGFDRGMDTASVPRSIPGVCPTCGQSESINSGLEQFLGRLGISDDMIEELKTSFQSADIEEYLHTAREYLKESGNKASMFARENPRKVVAGVAIAAVGAGLLLKALSKP